MKQSDVRKAVKGSEVVYVTVGFPYSLKVWKRSWPPFVKSIINACEEYNCKLVFFDIIYMYDANHLNGMDENTPINPPGNKGKVRAEIAKELGVKPRIQVAPKFLVRIMGLFIPIMSEMVEIMYQYDRDYNFNSTKYEKQFGYKPTSYTDGIKEIVNSDYKT